MQCSVPQSNPRSNLWARVGSSRHWDWMDMDRQTDGCYPPNLGKTPKPLAHHWALPCIKTCLWFRVCDLPPQPRRNGGSTASGILMGGGRNIFECGISAVLWRQSAWRDACAKTVALHIKPSRKKKPQTHPANTDRWQGDGRATIATTCWCSYFSPPALSLWFISKRKNMKVIIWTSLFLRQKIYLIP